MDEESYKKAVSEARKNREPELALLRAQIEKIDSEINAEIAKINLSFASYLIKESGLKSGNFVEVDGLCFEIIRFKVSRFASDSLNVTALLESRTKRLEVPRRGMFQVEVNINSLKKIEVKK